MGKEASPYAHIVHVEARTRCTSKAAERVINFAVDNRSAPCRYSGPHIKIIMGTRAVGNRAMREEEEEA